MCQIMQLRMTLETQIAPLLHSQAWKQATQDDVSRLGALNEDFWSTLAGGVLGTKSSVTGSLLQDRAMPS